MNSLNIPPKFHSKLDERQFAAATCKAGPTLCLASAGSGKTLAYAHRVAFLKFNGVREENILATTFTNKASKEMKERILRVCADNKIDIDMKDMWIGTFHSLGIRAARQFHSVIGYKENFTIIDDDDQERLIKEIIKQNKDLVGVKLKERDVLSAISFARNAKQDYKAVFEKKIMSTNNYAALVDVAEEYEARKIQTNVFDFDDMMIYWLDILKKNPVARNLYQEKFHHILVDESQDTNLVQIEIIDILSAKHRNVYLLGDIRQSIYLFRGAEIKNIINFKIKYPDYQEFNLINNYRSTQEIVDLSNASINNSKINYGESAVANKNGSIPKVMIPETEYDQNRHIIDVIKKAHNAGLPYKGIAVLYRNNNMAVQLEKELNKSNIPYVKKGNQFWKRAHLKLAVAWLRILQNYSDISSLERCLRMYEGVGDVAINKYIQAVMGSEDQYIDFLEGTLIIDPKKQHLFEEFRSHLLEMERIIAEEEDPIKSVVSYLVDYLTDYTIDTWELDGSSRAEDFDVVVGLAEDADSLMDLLDTISQQEDRKKNKNRDEITLSTGHAAKGLEWEMVFLIGVSSGIFPHKNTNPYSGDWDEEKRLFYVMLTRAKQRLYMYCPKFVKIFGKSTPAGPSDFIMELPENLYEVKYV